MSKISRMQLVVILILSRIFSEIPNIPQQRVQYGMQRFTVIFAAMAIMVVLYLPIYFISKKHPGENIIQITFSKSKVLAWVFGIIIIAVCFVVNLKTITSLDFYISNTILPVAPSYILIFLIGATVLYALYKGLEALSRTAFILSFLALILIILVGASSIGKVNYSFFYPALIDNPKTFLGDVLYEVSKNWEIIAFAIIFPFTNKNASSSGFLFIGIIFVVLELFAFFTNGILGPYLSNVSFPFYTIASLSDIVIFQRIDGIAAIVWIISGILKTSLFTIIIKIIIERLSTKKAGNISAVVIVILSFASAFFFTDKQSLLYAFLNIIGTGLPVFIAGSIIPLISLFISSLGKHKARGK